jgi:hypothetical protein
MQQQGQVAGLCCELLPQRYNPTGETGQDANWKPPTDPSVARKAEDWCNNQTSH